MSLFSGHDLTCERGGRIVFAGLGFDLAAGGALLLRGPNGSGKSSLLRLMAGLSPPAHGTLRWQGIDLEPAAHAARVSFIGHLDAIKARLTARENLDGWTAISGRTGLMSTADALAALGLAALADTPAQYLSAGQRRRLALARLLASRASVWLLDEPANALDADGVATLLRLITAHRADGGAVVVSLHGGLAIPDGQELDLADYSCDVLVPAS